MKAVSILCRHRQEILNSDWNSLFMQMKFTVTVSMSPLLLQLVQVVMIFYFLFLVSEFYFVAKGMHYTTQRLCWVYLLCFHVVCSPCIVL